MRATSVAGISPAPLLPLISTTCVDFLLARALPINMRKRNARCWNVSVLRRVYVTDSRIRSQVGRVVSRAPVQQGFQLRRLHSVWPVASAWLTGILAMNTARSSNDIGRPSQPTFVGTVAFSNPATDETLVATARMGDEEAFETLVKRHRSRIFALAQRYTRVREDAEDVVQQTFYKMFVYLNNFEGKSSFSTWLTRIAINEALMLLRRGRALREVSTDNSSAVDTDDSRLDIPDSSPDPEANCLKREGIEVLSAAINNLTLGLRTAIQLRELAELSIQETAQRMGLSVGAVKARVFHGRRKLRRTLRRPEITSKPLQRISCSRVANRMRSQAQ